jgi:hypothetical protein
MIKKEKNPEIQKMEMIKATYKILINRQNLIKISLKKIRMKITIFQDLKRTNKEAIRLKNSSEFYFNNNKKDLKKKKANRLLNKRLVNLKKK